MLNQISRMAVLVMAFGFLFSCSQTSNLERAETLKQDEQLSAALRAAQQATVSDPHNAATHLLKVEILAEMTRNYQPRDRRTLYTDMMAALHAVTEHAGGSLESTQRQRASEIVNERFNAEESAAQNILGSTEYLDDNSRLTAAAHLENARLIKPMEALVYDMLFEIYYELNHTDEALVALAAMHEYGVASDRHIAATGYLYSQNGQYEEAVPFLYESWNEGQGLINSGRGLVNALLQLDRQEEAREVLQLLSRLDGQRVESKLAYARILVVNGMDALSRLSTSETREANTQLFEQAMQDMKTAETEFEAALVLDQDYLLTNKTIGLYHRNLALRLRDIYEMVPYLSSEEREQELTDHFYQSLNYLELISEQQPENQQIWLALADVYTHLEMDTEAAEARNNAGAL